MGLWYQGTFPHVRPRRLRQEAWCRDLVAEVALTPADFIAPVFLRDEDVAASIPTMPGVQRWTLSDVPQLAEAALKAGIPALLLFPVLSPQQRNAEASESLNPDALLPRAVRLLKEHFPELGIMVDMALDAYTSHGHDGLMGGTEILNDETVAVLAQASLICAEAGADVIAPSDMMDGRVGVIRQHLDAAGYQRVRLMAYTAKYASAFYAPFREALGSASCLAQGDKRTYHMDPRNAEEALREAALDIQEGADILMVKPGGLYLDVLYRMAHAFPVPVAAYHVSGEYALLKQGAAQGLLDYDRALMETLIAFKRAGACSVVTYGAFEAVQLMRDGKMGRS